MLVQAEEGRLYAQVSAGSLVRLFTIEELAEWDDDDAIIVDVTEMIPQPDYDDTWDGIGFIPFVPRRPTEDRKRVALFDAVDAFNADPTVNPAAKKIITALRKFFT